MQQTCYHQRVVNSILVSGDWPISARVTCEMLDFCVVKCDLFYACQASLSIKLLCEVRIIPVGVKLLNYEFIVQTNFSKSLLDVGTYRLDAS